MTEIDMIPKPNLKVHVFIRILEDIGEFLPAEGSVFCVCVAGYLGVSSSVVFIT